MTAAKSGRAKPRRQRAAKVPPEAPAVPKEGWAGFDALMQQGLVEVRNAAGFASGMDAIIKAMFDSSCRHVAFVREKAPGDGQLLEYAVRRNADLRCWMVLAEGLDLQISAAQRSMVDAARRIAGRQAGAT